MTLVDLENRSIIVKDLNFTYHRLNPKVMSIKSLTLAKRDRKLYSRNVALRNINLDISRGETIGVIGNNGSGKSTLLRLIGGMYPPESGHIITFGNVAPLMDLGAGFHPELTARENIVLNSALLGRFEVDVERISKWADLEEQLEDPVRTFSSGMVARLAFAIATDVDPDILLIDEVLSVGDISFQDKSLKRTRSLIKSGGTVMMVSHSTELIKKECAKVVWLENGELIDFGTTNKMIKKYLAAQKN